MGNAAQPVQGYDDKPRQRQQIEQPPVVRPQARRVPDAVVERRAQQAADAAGEQRAEEPFGQGSQIDAAVLRLRGQRVPQCQKRRFAGGGSFHARLSFLLSILRGLSAHRVFILPQPQRFATTAFR